MEDYHSHRRRLHETATTTHREWVAGLDAKQRKKLQDLGVLEPADDSPEVGGHSPYQVNDVADTPLASIDPDIAKEVDDAISQLADDFKVPLETARALFSWHAEQTAAAVREHEGDLLSIVIGGLISSQNIRISAGALAFATELDALNGIGSQAAYARKLGVTRSALSKAVKGWRRSLGLRRNAHQKSAAACESYSENGKNNHWRKQKVTASRFLTFLRKQKNRHAS